MECKRYLKVLLLIAIFLLTGCKKNIINAEKFKEIADFNGYIVKKDKTGYESYNYIKDIYYAINLDGAYEVQYLILENNDYASKFFNVNREEIEKFKTKDCYIKSNSKLYHLEDEESYMLVTREENNIIYVIAPIDYINEIEEFLSELDIDY